MLLRLTISLGIVFPAQSIAGAQDYQCVVNQELVPSYITQNLGPGVGKLEPPKSPTWVGTRFAVDRKTGRIVGSLLDTSGAEDVKVIERGSDKMAFKMIATGNGKIKLLVIRENTPAAEKEFYGVFHPSVLAGMCR